MVLASFASNDVLFALLRCNCSFSWRSMLKSVSPLFVFDRNCEQKQESATPVCERTLFLSFGCPMHWRSQLCDSFLVKCREVFFHLVQGERDRVGHLPFCYYLHQTRQVHLVVVIVCLVILPASSLRLHSSVTFQLRILNMGVCFAFPFAWEQLCPY